jgi:ubiquinone biosynthesis protein
MRVLRIRRTMRHARRLREILSVLLKYGFEDGLERIKVNSHLGRGRKLVLRQQARAHLKRSRAERIRLAIEELGPAFIKLGQMLSTRYDLLPQEITDELRKLQDRIPAFPSATARAIVATEFGRPLETLFRDFSDEPVAAASIAQVHRATALDGRRLALKIQRPAIASVIRRDVEILTDLARLISRTVPESAPMDPVGVVEEFGRWIEGELDFFQEGRNTDRFRLQFAGDRTVRVPVVHWDLSTARVLALEYLDGTPVGDPDAAAKSGADPRRLARAGARVALKAVFEHGFFHGDPHPGNIFVLRGGTLVLLDFGLVGRLDEEHIELLGRMLGGVLNRDTDRILRSLGRLGALRDDGDPAALRADLRDFVDRYAGAPLYQLRIERIIREMLALFSRHRIRLPRDLYLMGKALMEVEGIARRLDPQIDMLSIAEPFIRKTLVRRMGGRRLARDAGGMIEDYRDFMGALPDTLRQILVKLRRGDLGVNLHHQGLSRLIREMDRSSNRLSVSLVTAALLVASSLIISINRGPMLFGLSAFGLVGYVIAGVFGLWLIVAVMRSGRM